MAAAERAVEKDAVGLWGRRERLAELIVRHALPALYQFRRLVAAGGLVSCGSSETEYGHLMGTCAGKILRGDKPADLPVQQAAKLELMLNLKTAKALGLTIPLPLVDRRDNRVARESGTGTSRYLAASQK